MLTIIRYWFFLRFADVTSKIYYKQNNVMAINYNLNFSYFNSQNKNLYYFEHYFESRFIIYKVRKIYMIMKITTLGGCMKIIIIIL